MKLKYSTFWWSPASRKEQNRLADPLRGREAVGGNWTVLAVFVISNFRIPSMGPDGSVQARPTAGYHYNHHEHVVDGYLLDSMIPEWDRKSDIEPLSVIDLEARRILDQEQSNRLDIGCVRKENLHILCKERTCYQIYRSHVSSKLQRQATVLKFCIK